MTDNNIQGKVLSLFPNLSRRSPQGEDGTPSPFSKPFIGIYLFVTQIDKCPLSFEKILFNIFTVNQPILGTEPIHKKNWKKFFSSLQNSIVGCIVPNNRFFDRVIVPLF